MDADAIRRRARKILRATMPTGTLTHGFWVGDAAAERMGLDDFNAGRRAWRGAYDGAVSCLEALDNGNIELAEILMWQANDLFIDALWSRMEPADIAFLANGAGPRGRPSRTRNRNDELSSAVAEQERLGLKGKAARRAALAANPSLAAEFLTVSDDTLRKAIQRHRNQQS